MGRRRKATNSRLLNLSRSHQQPYDIIQEELLNLNAQHAGGTDDSKSDSENSDETGGGIEVFNETDLSKFASQLQKAHDEAAAVEKEMRAQRMRPLFYSGNSKRTQQHWASKRRKFVAEGGKLISHWFTEKKDEEGITLSAGQVITPSEPTTSPSDIESVSELEHELEVSSHSQDRCN